LRAGVATDEARNNAKGRCGVDGAADALRRLRMLGHAGAQLFLEGEKIGHALIDLHEQIGAGAVNVLVAKLNDHLREAAYCAHNVDRVAFTGRVGIAAHVC
jgi:hypothetical protein